MKIWIRRFTLLCAAALGVAAVASTASAFPLRAPQVVFNSPPLQTYLTGVDPGINVTTQQLDAQTWATSVTGNAEFTLMLRSGTGVAAAIGIYNASAGSPALYELLPGTALAGSYALVNFNGGNLTVSLFDQNSVFQGQNVYNGVDPNNFGFYIQGPAGLWYSQDYRNANGAQMLTFDSPSFPGNYWLCFDSALRTAQSTFDSVVFNVQSIRASPAVRSSWGSVKAGYR